MADQYGLFFNSINGDRVYDADSFAEWLNKFFTTGVFNGELQVTADSGMTVNVASGYANINGKVRFFEQSQTFTLDPASGVYPRIDSIVVRLDTTNRMITTEYVKGDCSGNNPQPTEPTRTGGLYEIVLAQIYVSAGATQILTNDITDTRSDDSVCGWVTSTVEGVPMDQIVAQMTADFMTWFDHMKDQLDTDAAGHLQQEIDMINAAVSSIETTVSNHSKSLGIIEDGETASQLHHRGQYFVRNGRFVYAMIEIAEGDTLTLGSNYMYTDVGSQLETLNNGLTDLLEWKTLSPRIGSNGTFTLSVDISIPIEIMVEFWFIGQTVSNIRQTYIFPAQALRDGNMFPDMTVGGSRTYCKMTASGTTLTVSEWSSASTNNRFELKYR